MLKERLPKEVRLNGTYSSGADDDRNDRDTIREARNQQVESGKKTKKNGNVQFSVGKQCGESVESVRKKKREATVGRICRIGMVCCSERKHR